ncbi:MAG: hypothetical protein SPF22_07780 [Candidatus Onthovivens sp.]|nr:hypothetical protein [Candidatus Onthovivens sp.]
MPQWLECYVPSNNSVYFNLPIVFTKIKLVSQTSPNIIEEFWQKPSCLLRNDNNLDKISCGVFGGSGSYHLILCLGY